VLDHGGFDQNSAIEIAQTKLGPGFGAVDTDHTKVLRADRLDTLGELPTRLLHQETPGFLAPTETSHETPP
jgi:hypothetical protein